MVRDSLSDAFSGVRLVVFPGSTEGLNQSSLDVTNLLFYKESKKAEDYLILAARLAPLLPDFRRLYRDPELIVDGTRTGIYVRLVLTADKPFIRHALGLLSHNADAFGRPYCDCHDAQLYDFTKDKRTHYGDGTLPFEMLCARAHIPVWQALGEPEPQSWSMTCDCCDTTWSSSDGGLDRLQKERDDMAEQPENVRARELEKHAKRHHGQGFDRPPLLPVHYVVFDPMHGVHMEGNVLFDEAIHQHLALESPDAEVQQVLDAAKRKVNDLWASAHLPKFIQFGKDGKGAHTHAMNGPTFKAVMRNAPLLKATFQAMQPVYALLDAKKLSPPLNPAELDKVPAPKEKRKGQSKQPRKKKARGSSFCDVGASDEEEAEEEEEEPAAEQGERLNGEALSLCTLRESECELNRNSHEMCDRVLSSPMEIHFNPIND